MKLENNLKTNNKDIMQELYNIYNLKQIQNIITSVNKNYYNINDNTIKEEISKIEKIINKTTKFYL